MSYHDPVMAICYDLTGPWRREYVGVISFPDLNVAPKDF